MIGVLLALVLGFVLYAIVRAAGGPGGRPIVQVLVGAYLVRLFLQLFLRDLPLFSRGMAGGDYYGYENWAVEIARIWEVTGIRYITSDTVREIGVTSLPPNLFALVIYLNGGRTGFGCTSVVAFFACLTCLNLYKLAVEFGANPDLARRWMMVFAFMPAFLYYTADMYKDGLVVFLVLGAFGSALRLSRRFSLGHLVFGAVCVWALWYVRFYLIFITTSPLLIGLVGIGSKSAIRPLIATLAIATVAVIIVATSTVFEDVTDSARETYLHSVEVLNRDADEDFGSGVVFNDGGSPFGALGPKALYTLFSPFPWTMGSLGLQLSKIDVLLWYYLAYQAFRSGRRLRRTSPTTLLMFLTFLIPTTLMYATGMNNMGIAIRERLPIVTLTTLLALIGWETVPKGEPVGEGEPSLVTLPERTPRTTGSSALAPRRA